MTVANLATSIRRALYGKMAGDTTLNGLLGTKAPGRAKSIYYAYAPDGADFPYVIFNKQAGTPTYTFARGYGGPAGEYPATAGTVWTQTYSAFDNEIWLIKGVAHDGPDIAAEDPMDAADNIASRLDILLNDAILSPASGITQLSLRRDSDVVYSETSDGESYYHHGALYRLIYSV